MVLLSKCPFNMYIANMKILAVCLGNICRSPLAKGILLKLTAKNKLDWEIDAAGTSDWHVGEPPCEGSIRVAAANDIDIRSFQARQIKKSDLANFDLILAMDTSNLNTLRDMARNEEEYKKIKLVLNYSYPGQNRSVPDSYFTGNYQEVFDLLYKACVKIVDQLNDK